MPELQRSELGNKSDELGALDRGADVEGLNQSGMPSGRVDPLEVDVRRVDDGVSLVPVVSRGVDRGDSLRGLDEGPMDLMMAQLVEEPEEIGFDRRVVNGVSIYAKESRISEVTKRSPREALIYFAGHPRYDMAVSEDRVMILKDILEDEDSCLHCHGRGYMEDEVCPTCSGSLKWIGSAGIEVDCIDCLVLGYEREHKWSCGHKPCEKCYGTGWRSGIVIPEVAERKPITGIVVSVGPYCVRGYRIGDHVLHSRFAGHDLTVEKNTTLTIMRETEIITILKQRR